ncbi:MAG TPA: hypothetical protein VN830_04655 [Verrucomicrobiae bacterium]|nr:hypothetical protein [Verrucomicrobiae bacterium]
MRPIYIAIAAAVLTVSVLASGAAKRQPTPPNSGNKGPRPFVVGIARR